MNTEIDKSRSERGLARRLLWTLSMEYWRRLRGAGGRIRAGAIRVLCYHAIADLAREPVLELYRTPISVFAAQIELLQRAAYQFIPAEDLLRNLKGQGSVPRKAVLLTLCDCYLDSKHAARTVLSKHAISTSAFAVASHLGGHNTSLCGI